MQHVSRWQNVQISNMAMSLRGALCSTFMSIMAAAFAVIQWNNSGNTRIITTHFYGNNGRCRGVGSLELWRYSIVPSDGVTLSRVHISRFRFGNINVE